jgi:hypothetical protein
MEGFFAGLPRESVFVIPLQTEPSINWSHQTKKSGVYVPHEHCKRGQSEAGNPVDVTWILAPCWWSRLPFTVDANNPQTLYTTSCLGCSSPTQRRSSIHRPKAEETNCGFSIITVIHRQVSSAVNFNFYIENIGWKFPWISRGRF